MVPFRCGLVAGFVLDEYVFRCGVYLFGINCVTLQAGTKTLHYEK